MTNYLSYLLVIFSAICLTACQEKQGARAPIAQNTTSILDNSLQRNAELTQEQQDLFAQYIQRDTQRDYNHSNQGFYYTYLHRELQDSITPKSGDMVIFNYQISDLQDQVIYSFEQISTQSNLLDKQDLLPVLRHAIKILKSKEVIKVLAPSELAYSYLGDSNKIAKNQPLIFTIELQSIQK